MIPPTIDIEIAIHNPQLPGIFPDGIGRVGSLIESTSLSYQSFTAWLIPQIIGPDSRSPTSVIHRVSSDKFELETAPQRKAHIGGNHVTGLMSANMAEKEGKVLSGSLEAVVIYSVSPKLLLVYRKS